MMMRQTLGLLLVALLAAACVARGGAASPSGAGATAVRAESQVTGVLRLVGNEPFPRLVVTDASNRTVILEGEREVLRSYRRWLGKQVRASGPVQEQAIHTADGRYITTEVSMTVRELVLVSGN